MTSAKLHFKVKTVFVVISSALVLALGAFGWWAASNIDDRSIARETRAVRMGLEELLERIPLEQDTSAVWTDAVIHIRAGDEDWLAENLAEWVSEYFGHDTVYLVGPTDLPVRAVRDGVRVSDDVFESDRAVLGPMISELRATMASAAVSTPDDATAAISGLGLEDIRAMPDGRASVVSIRPILPTDGTLVQGLSEIYLHISIVDLGPEVTKAIGTKFEIADLQFERHANSNLDRVATPVMDGSGRMVGFFSWTPYEPAYQLIVETSPVVAVCVLALMLFGALLITRLQRTTKQLAETEAQATFFAYHDPLTRLPNRALFEQELKRALSESRRNGTLVILHCIDLDHFKSVNDTLGHPAGDALLIQVAQRLGALIGENDILARLGGDEFALIQTEVADVADALGIAQRMVSALEQPFDLNGHEVTISGSVGLMSADDPSTSPEDLIGRADMALYEAKTGGRNRYMLYGGELGNAVRDRLSLEVDLRAALRGEHGLGLVYQPIFCAKTHQILGAEALLRWDHPTKGRLSPAVFVKLAEERGLIKTLGLWVLQNACSYAVSCSLPWIAVNVSPIQFRDEKFADRVFEVLSTTGLAPSRLEIEVTEGLLLQNSSEVQETLRVLRARGVRVALDDFGTGYSSISYLRTYGVDKLKIDQSFTAQLGRNQEIDSIVRSIIDLGRAMKMKLTAEGVETIEQRDMLLAIGCDQLQGYLLARPVSGEDLHRFLDQSVHEGRRA